MIDNMKKYEILSKKYTEEHKITNISGLFVDITKTSLFLIVTSFLLSSSFLLVYTAPEEGVLLLEYILELMKVSVYFSAMLSFMIIIFLLSMIFIFSCFVFIFSLLEKELKVSKKELQYCLKRKKIKDVFNMLITKKDKQYDKIKKIEAIEKELIKLTKEMSSKEILLIIKKRNQPFYYFTYRNFLRSYLSNAELKKNETEEKGTMRDLSNKKIKHSVLFILNEEKIRSNEIEIEND